MTYDETLDYLYTAAPLFQQVGPGAYKPGLDTTLALDRRLGYAHRRYRTLHIGGTNGKGSCAHTIAAMLRAAGLRVGLYTSPHLVDFRERIRVDGQMIGKEEVVDFVERERTFFEPLHPSFFELTTALAFRYFADCAVDVAVVEVGLGGRLDATNIISPLFSVITNISLDHTALLGATREAIAAEKAGIIKPATPVVVGEADEATRPVFVRAARAAKAPLVFADTAEAERFAAEHAERFALKGEYQRRNLRTVGACLPLLEQHFGLSRSHVEEGLGRVVELTGGPRGRWERHGRTLLDAGHNAGGWALLGPTLGRMAAERPLHIVFGCAEDKDIDAILPLLPPSARYYWTQAGVRRALPAERLAAAAAAHGLAGQTFADVPSAFRAAEAATAGAADATIYVGGSCFVVADWLAAFDHLAVGHIRQATT